MPITAKMNMIMANTKVKLPRSPTVLPMIDISKFSVGQDLANLNTRSYFGLENEHGDRQNRKKKKRNTYLIYWKAIFHEYHSLLMVIIIYIFVNILITKRNDRNTDSPETDDRLTSNSDRTTITKSNIFQPSRK